MNHAGVPLQKDGYHGLQAPSDDTWDHRLWHSGALTFHRQLRYGEAAECDEDTAMQILGTSTLAKIKRIIRQNDALAVTEERNLVYIRGDLALRTPSASASREEHELGRFSFTSADIALYSELTDNEHRIHNDLDYARDIEGYTNVLVQGSLLITALLRSIPGDVASCSYRMLAPCYPDETLHVVQQTQSRFSILGSDGSLRLTCTVRPAIAPAAEHKQA